METTFHDMPVISVRLAPEQQAFLKRHKLKPGPFAKEAVDRAIRVLEVEESHAWLAKHRIKADRSVVDIIREDRDHGHGDCC